MLKNIVLGIACATLLLGASETKTTEETAETETWRALFDGETTEGWEAVGRAEWTVEDGVLIGRQGNRHRGGDLLTTETFGDFELEVVYRVNWPANSGIWFRYQTPNKAYQADILEYADPEAYSGTLYSPGKLFLAINEDPDLDQQDGWNTLRIHCQGDRLQIWLNGKQTADVTDPDQADGHLGIQVHSGEEFDDMRIEVKEVKVRGA